MHVEGQEPRKGHVREELSGHLRQFGSGRHALESKLFSVDSPQIAPQLSVSSGVFPYVPYASRHWQVMMLMF